jgi:hypothetical protein
LGASLEKTTMNFDSRKDLEQVVLGHTEQILSELKSFALKENLTGKLSNGCWSNENGVLVGWVRYLPHNEQEEDSIELVFTFSGEVKNGSRNFDIGIYWTDGSVIQAISEYDDIDFENTYAQVDSIIEKSKSELVSKMMKEISINRPPHYRAD